MRRLIYFAVALTMLLASCAKDEATVADGEALVTFNVAAADMGTRVYGDGVAAHDLEYAIYEKGSYSQPLIQKEIAGAFPATTMSTAFTEKLVKGKTYVVLFWADAEQDPYTVNWNDQTVSITDPAALKSQDENLDAFFKAHEVSVGQDNQTEKIELRRPFAQLNIGTSDTEAAATAGLEVKQTEVAVSAYTTLNLMNGTVSNAMMLTYALADIPSGENATFTVKEKVYDHLSMNYLLVDEKELIDVAFTVNDGSTNVNTANFAKVPVERNYKTFIIGELLTSPVNIDIIIIPDWMKPDHIYDGNIVVEKAEVESGKTGGDEIVTFTAKEAWTAQVVAGAMRADESWCTVEPTSGDAGDAEITITTRPNDTGEDRSATVVIQAGESTQSITVTQYAVELPDEGEEEENPVPNNEIWYTSTDGSVVEASTIFGAEIVSNIYENGKGVITFDGDVTQIGQMAYWGNRGAKLKTITIPASVTAIGKQAFSTANNIEAFYGKFATEDNKALIVDGVFHVYARNCGATEYIIPDGVTEIATDAFNWSTSLQNVTIPNSVTKIGDFAFQACKSIENITLPESVEYIGMGSFSLDENLKNVYCKNTTPPTISNYGTFDVTTSTGLKIYVPAESLETYKTAEGWKNYADYIFADPSTEGDDEEATTPPNNEIWYTSTDGNVVTPYKTDVFGAAITSNTYEDGKGVITFDGEVTAVGKDAFYRGTGATLETITLPKSVTEIGDYAFSYCSALKNISMRNGITKIGKSAFYSCQELTNIILPNSLIEIGENAFKSSGLTSITIPESVTIVGDTAFLFCNNLRAFYGKGATDDNRCLVIDGVIKAFALANYESDIYTIPYGATTVGYNAFSNLTILTEIIIPESITTIDRYAFASNNGLLTVTLPKSITTIGMSAFQRCQNLATVYCKSATPSTLSTNVFFGNAEGLKIYVPASSVEAYKTADGWKDYADYIFAEGNEEATTPPNNEIWYTSTDGNVVTPNNVEAFGAAITSNTYENGKGVITFDGEVTKIGDTKASNAFLKCSNLSTIILPNSVTQIGPSAFSGCSNLTNIILPESVNKIETFAFIGTGIINISIPSKVTIIASGVFSNCKMLSSVTIPNGVTNIEEQTFRNCSRLSEIVFPKSLKSIGFEAFSECSGLKKVYFQSSTPPTLHSTSFKGMLYYSGDKLYVPNKYIDAYKEAWKWHDVYYSRITGYDFE